MRLPRFFVLAAAGAIAAGALSACGDRITAAHEWASSTVLVSSYQPVIPSGGSAAGARSTLFQSTLSGPLLDGRGRPAAGTHFQEKCSRTVSSTMINTKWACLVVLDAGAQVYVARNDQADGVFGTLTSLASPGSTATITISKIKELAVGQSVGYQIRISARTG